MSGRLRILVAAWALAGCQALGDWIETVTSGVHVQQCSSQVQTADECDACCLRQAHWAGTFDDGKCVCHMPDAGDTRMKGFL